MMSLVLLLIVSFDFNETMSRKGYLKGNMKNNENKYINVQKYILNILEKLTDAHKQLFLQRLWYILYCPVWQKRIGKHKSAETEHGQHSPLLHIL